MKISDAVVNGVGKNVPIGTELGRGGEGSVYEISSASTIVAKVYHEALQPKKQEKIATMVRLKQDQLLKFSTWPVDVLRNHENKIIGFIMHKLTGKEIHKLYSPKNRLIEFPQANYAFLVHTAANLARAFAAVHEGKHVIGDVNHGNFYVTDQGTVTLVDCDSFQIHTNQEIFRCEVGIPMYQPPELQKVSSYRNIERNANHDNFGLALFIFMLLFLGRHPFSGVYSGSEDMPIEKAIEQFRFAYGGSAVAKQMKPPPGAPQLNTVPTVLAQMFERAFGAEGVQAGNRPSAEEWISNLEELSRNLRKCAVKEQHHYSNHLLSCPWCDIENKTGIVLFNSQPNIFTPNSSGAKSKFELHIVWSRIATIPKPSLGFSIPDFSSLTPTPSKEALIAARKRRWRRRIALICLLLISGGILLVPGAWVLFSIASVVVLVSMFQSNDSSRALKERYEKVKKEKESLISRWSSDTEAGHFYDKYRALESCKREYEGIETLRTSRLKELQSKQRDLQLDRYLQGFRIDNAKIEGIGLSRTATLQSFGIETAADVSRNVIQQVPGFGPSYTRRLLEWKDSIARRFVYNPAAQTVSPGDLAALDRDMSLMRQRFEQQLTSGVSQIQQIADQISMKRAQIQQEALSIAKEFSQAETDYNVLKSSKWI